MLSDQGCAVGVNLGSDTLRVSKNYGTLPIIQKEYIPFDGCVAFKMSGNKESSSRCFNYVKLNLTLTINPHFLMCLSIIGDVTTEAITRGKVKAVL